MIDPQRLKLAIEMRELDQNKLAEICGCTQPTISQIVSNARPASAKMAVKLVALFGEYILKERIIPVNMKYFEYKHLPEKLQDVSKPVGELAEKMNKELPEGAEKSAGLRKLLEAKDCFVRSKLG